MKTDSILFRYHHPWLYRLANLLCVGALLIAVYFFMNQLSFPRALTYSFLSFLTCIFLLWLAQKYLEDIDGGFTFKDGGFELCTFFKKQFILYNDITSISKEHYNQRIDLFITSATQPVYGQYSIRLRNNQLYIFRIARSEEKAYLRSLNQLEQKIFKTNRFGIYLTSRLKENEANTRQQNRQFENEKPQPNYSLEAAINQLALRSDLQVIE